MIPFKRTFPPESWTLALQAGLEGLNRLDLVLPNGLGISSSLFSETEIPFFTDRHGQEPRA